MHDWSEKAGVMRSLVDILHWRAQRQPDERLYTFLLSDESSEDQHLTYREFEQRVRAVASLLQQADAMGRSALLLYPPGLDYVVAFFGCLYAGVVAIPAYPPNPARLERTLPRIQAIVANAQPAIVLTSAVNLPLAQALAAHDPLFESLRWIATDSMSDVASLAARWQHPEVDGDMIALLQYTSGSTSTPKGVMVSHGNLLHNSAQIRHYFGHSESSSGVIWLPPYHDMGLIGGIIQPLYAGFPVTLMAPATFLQRPIRWLEAITRYRASTSGGPNFAYDLCVRNIPPEEREQLDLSSWQVAFNGAEPIRAETIDRFVAAFGPYGFSRAAFYPCYGLAEATLIVSGGSIAAPPVKRAFDGAALGNNQVVAVDAEDQDKHTRVLVGCGQVFHDQQLAIVDPETRVRQPSGMVGEIWVAGPSVAQGYWQQPEATAHAFQAQLADTGAGPFLRTGDLGFVQDGELFITGRLKDLIIIRGRNYYPQDIEQTVEQSHAAFRAGCGTAFTVEVAGEERLVIVQELDRQYRNQDTAALIETARRAVAEQHELAVYAVVLIRHGTIPKTSSGKVQRHMCRRLFLSGELRVVGSSMANAAETTAAITITRETIRAAAPAERVALLELYIKQHVAQALNLPATSVALDSSQTLMLDSLMAVELQHRLETDLGVSLALDRLLNGLSGPELVADLLAVIDAPPAAQTPRPIVSEQPASEPLPLSAGQSALWFLHQLAPENSAYIIALAARIRGGLDLDALRWSLQRVVDRHAALRTSFPVVAGAAAQQIHDRLPVDLVAHDAQDYDEDRLRQELAEYAYRPFDLADGPLFRVHVWSRGTAEQLVLLAFHHLIVDLWSLELLVGELDLFYRARRSGSTANVPLPPLSYADYARWQREMLLSEHGRRLESYWKQQLRPDASRSLPALNLPTDRPRPPIQTFRGASQTFNLDQQLTEQIRQLAQSESATLYMVLLAAFQVLLARYSHQTEIVVGSPMVNRPHAPFAQIIGYFANPVVLRADLSADPSFTAFLAQVRATVLAAVAHQEYPFAALVEQLQPERDPSRPPLVQALFSFQQASRADRLNLAAFALGAPGLRLNIGDLELHSVPLEQAAAQFDLSLTLAETDHGLVGSLNYNSDLFEPDTATRLIRHFQSLLSAISSAPQQRISRLPLLPADEYRQIVEGWNATQMPYAEQICVHQSIALQAARVPDAPAAIFDDRQLNQQRARSESGLVSLSYRELEQRANQLARFLRRRGVGPDVIVGVYVERSLDMLVALLGVLKAGGAYLPLDPSFPAERLEFMLEDAQVPILLTQARLLDQAPQSAASLLCVDRDWALIAEEDVSSFPVEADPTQLAYVIYTSGSSGKPKGVQIQHRALTNFLAAMRRQFPLSGQDIWLAITTLSFDIAVLELFLPLTSGATTQIVSRDVATDGLQLRLRVEDGPVTFMQATPTTWRLLLEAGWRGNPQLTMLSGGEALPLELVQPLCARGKQLYNMYGPTETTVWSATTALAAAEERVPVGRPIANTQIYLLDRQFQPVPPGVVGEIYIGGEGVVRGYLNRPALTAQQFVPDPFARPDGSRPGTRLYRTGDSGRYLPDGTIEFLGRGDNQVKIRGYRIELGEIEAWLRRHPLVQQAVVIAHAESADNVRLVGYLVRNSQVPESGSSSAPDQAVADPSQAVRQSLQEHLPAYMIPSTLIWLDALPLTPNGKIDRRALPAPDHVRQSAGQAGEYVAPRNPIEQKLAELVARLLDVQQVGVRNNFFDLGGHSLLISRLVIQVRELFQVDVPLRSLFDEPTVERLALLIEQHTQQSASNTPLIARAAREEYRTTRSGGGKLVLPKVMKKKRAAQD
jgi:amino acid adenylation domain-containing protein